MGRRKEYYREYVKSPVWAQLKDTMPGEKECVGCGSTVRLHLHHMYYPQDVFDTRHKHCCWLCKRCHRILHRLYRNGIHVGKRSWLWLKQETARVIQEELASHRPIRESEEELAAFRDALERDAA